MLKSQFEAARRIAPIMVIVLVLAGCSSSGSSSTAAPPTPTAAVSAPATAAPKPTVQPEAKAPIQPTVAPTTAAAKVDFPIKPIEIILTSAPGGGADALARALAPPLQKQLGQPVVIKNVPGGGQRLAVRQFNQAPSDGHTLMYTTDTNLFIGWLMEPEDGFDPSAWKWVAGIRKAPAAVFTGKDSPYKSIKDVVAADQAGTRIRMGHGGLGNYFPQQVMLATALGLKNAAFVGGFAGTADLAPALIRGDLDLQVFQPLASTIEFVRSGDTRPLVMLGPQRDPLLPDTPTAREAGLARVDDLETLGSRAYASGFAVLPQTAPERVKILEQAVLSALKDPEFVTWAKTTNVESDLAPMPGDQFAESKKQEYSMIRPFEDVFRSAQ